jgi:site-specific DNA recombinase
MKRNARGAPPPASSTVRCAIYTRKSTEEGLDQDFNSLDAQREAAEAYITSQRGEGWEVVPDRYDDGGFSGGNMDRPALTRLLADIEAGRVNAVVVYKVDRLSRSLLDFSKIMEVLDGHRVAFVSVTQQFNTATSMGRLILHVLLSFAQFEREMIAERTRDKMSAARRKGKWVGGTPVLGYDVAPDGGRIVVNEAEAHRVREIFDLYLREQSLVATAEELNRRGWTTKAWTTREGRPRDGSPLDRNNLFRMLANVLYTGRVNHKGTIFPGEHPAIVDPEVWRRTQTLLRHNGRTGGKGVRNKLGALLPELLRSAPCDASPGRTYMVTRGPRDRRRVGLVAWRRDGDDRGRRRGRNAGAIAERSGAPAPTRRSPPAPSSPRLRCSSGTRAEARSCPPWSPRSGEAPRTHPGRCW